MLNLLDQVIENVLSTGWTITSPPGKPGFFFTIPDDAWLTKLKAGVGERLNIYLYDVRENREFRRPEWDRVELSDHSSVLSQPPVYFDCHYLISAWSSIEDSEALTPIFDEHALLSEALRVILRNPDVIPQALGVATGGDVFRNAHVYLSLAAPETPRVLNDFWSTMKLPWRVAIQLIATAPLDLLKDSKPELPVTTFIQQYGLMGTSGVEERIQIGGWVLKKIGKTPIRGATVQRLTSTGEVLEQVLTDSQGRYSFAGLRAGVHPLHVEASGHTSIDRTLNVPTGPAADHVFELT
jgi:hypothetical protein